jgi:hypothetical protein
VKNTGPDDGRLLRFFSSTTANPRRLGRDQVRQFNERGYIKGLPVYTPAEADRNRRVFDALLEEIVRADDGRDAYSINGYHTQCADLYDMVINPRVLGYVEDILGPSFVCWGTHYFCKMPGDPRKVPWHQDASYWPLSPSKTVTAWLAVDDADEENGAMQVLPGSHLEGHLAFETAKPDEKVVLHQKVLNPERFGPPVYFAMKAGEISLHSDLLVHGSDANLSTRRRCGLTMRYASVDVVAGQGWHKNAVLCRGADPESHWANVPRPAGNSTAPMPWQVANARG